MMAIRSVCFRPYRPDKGTGKDCIQNKGQRKVPKEKARKKLILNPGFQHLKRLKKKDIAMFGNLMTGLPVA